MTWMCTLRPGKYEIYFTFNLNTFFKKGKQKPNTDIIQIWQFQSNSLWLFTAFGMVYCDGIAADVVVIVVLLSYISFLLYFICVFHTAISVYSAAIHRTNGHICENASYFVQKIYWKHHGIFQLIAMYDSIFFQTPE